MARRRDAGGVLLARIREEIRDRGLSAYAVAHAAGVAPSIVQRLISGARDDVALSTASRICGALALRLVPTAARRVRRPADGLVDVAGGVEEAGT